MPHPATRPPALAIMAKVPVPGRVKTRLCPPLDAQQAASLARAFLLDTLAAAFALKRVAVFWAYSPPDAGALCRKIAGQDIACLPQEGDDLGQRMDRLSRRLLAAGHPAVAILGTDAPTLPAAILVDALHRIAGGRADLVFGPSEDGGYYLVGLRRPLPDLFVDIDWGGPAVLADSLERARRLGLSASLLPSWFDVDTPEDLARLRRALADGGTVPPHTRRCLADLFPAAPPEGPARSQ